jgi:hypothetical protein
MYLVSLSLKNLLSSRDLIFNQSNDTFIGTDGINYVTSFGSNRIKFGIFLTLQLLTFPCFINAFLQYKYRQKLRKNIAYDVIFLLLFTSFIFVTIVLSFSQAYMYTSYVYPSSDIFCSFWNWFHYSINIINLFLMAFASIERNILIFHPRILRSQRGKYHYCPILFCLFYPSMFYFGAIFLCPCTNYYDYTQLLCTWPCYFGNKTWAMIDLFFNNYTPLLIIPIFCSMIYIRVFYHKRSMRLQLVKWRRDKKLIVQLLAISSLYLGMWMPLQISGLVDLYWDPTFLIQAQIDYMYLFPYFIHIIYPFIVFFIIHRKGGNFMRNTIAIHPDNSPGQRE